MSNDDKWNILREELNHLIEKPPTLVDMINPLLKQFNIDEWYYFALHHKDIQGVFYFKIEYLKYEKEIIKYIYENIIQKMTSGLTGKYIVRCLLNNEWEIIFK